MTEDLRRPETRSAEAASRRDGMAEEIDMAHTRPEPRAWQSRATDSLAYDHGIIRRWCRAVIALCREADWAARHPSMSPGLVAFCEDFIDRFHFRREERLLLTPIERYRGELAGRVEEIRCNRDLFHSHLEGMRRGASCGEPGAATLFSWNAIAAAGILMRGMDAEEEYLFREVEQLESRGRLEASTEADAAEVAATYAQAESTLLTIT